MDGARVALITTTIYVPDVLRLYRAFDDSVRFFIAGDRKTPDDRVRALVAELGNAEYLSAEDQAAMGTAVSELIGWNRIMRRNLALLKAIQGGYEVIVTIDDDNIPISDDYFAQIRRVLTRPFNGLALAHDNGWVDIGQLLEPPVPHRGFPLSKRDGGTPVSGGALVGGAVGVAAGLWFGDPDVDAMTRLRQAPLVTRMSGLLDAGLVVAPGCRTVFNSQNTAFRREIAPAMMVLAEVGRYDDIWASLIAQRIMRERGLLVHFGRPYVWQQRNPQDLTKNLEDERFGLRHSDAFAQVLQDMGIGGGGVVEQLRRIYDTLAGKDILPERAIAIGRAWCDDVAAALETAGSRR